MLTDHPSAEPGRVSFRSRPAIPGDLRGFEWTPAARSGEDNHSVKSLLLQRAAMGLLLLAIAAGFYWKITLTDQYTWFGSPDGDISAQVLPWFQFEAREFRHGRMPLWDPHQWLGQPMLGQGQPGGAYPLNWLLFLLPLRDGLIRVASLNWYFVLIHLMAIVFAYALCRDLGRSRSASLIAGCVFGLAGYVGTTDWPQMINGAVWAPLVLLFLLRAVRGRSPLFSAALSGGCLGLAWLSGHHQIPIYTTLMAGAVWLFFALEKRRAQWPVVRLAAISFAAMFLVGALQTLPMYDYGKFALRWVGAPNPIAWNEKVPYSVHAQYSLPPSTLIGIFVPGISQNGDPFVGVAAFALALAGYALAWRRRVVRVFTAIAVAGLLFALGFHNVFHGIVYALAPLAEKARVPAAAVFIFQVGLIVLVAFGADAFFSPEIQSRWKGWIAVGTAVFGFLLWGLYLEAGLGAKLKFDFDDRIALSGLIAILIGGLLLAFLKGRLARSHTIAALVILLLIELGNDSGYAFRQIQNGRAFPEKFANNADVAQFLKQQPGPFRVEIDDSEVPQNFGDWYGIDILLGLGASAPANVLAMEWSTPRDKELLNVGYYLSKKPARPDQVSLFEGASGLKVYRNPQYFPRAWVVHQALAVGDMSQVNRLIQDPNVDLRRGALIRGTAPGLESCPAGSDQVQVARHSSGSVELDATLACRGLVVLSETYAPGWVATVDGRPAQILEVDGALRGVAAPSGTHRIQMRYRPWSSILGALFSAAGVLGIGMLGFLNRKRPKNYSFEREDI